MKNNWRYLAAGVALLAALAQAWSTQLMAQPNLDEMFIAEDTDGFDPGLAARGKSPPSELWG